MLTKRPGSPYWQIEFQLLGLTVRRSSGTLEKKKAEKLEQQYRQDLWNQKKLGEAPKKTWKAAREEYVELKKSKRSISRDTEILRMAGLKMDEHGVKFDDKPVASITETDLVSYAAMIAGATSQSNADTHLRYVRTFLKLCAKRKYIPEIPAIEFFKPPKFEPTVISKEQYGVLLRHLPGYLLPLATFGAETGLRWSNIATLRWEPAKPGQPFVPYVDREGKFVHIPASSAKANKPIHIPLSTKAWDTIRDMERSKTGYVFINHDGTGQVIKARKAWKTACKRAGIPGLRFHDLRHAWCSWQIQAGVPERVVQELGGWNTRSMVQRYSHLDIEHLKEWVR